MPTLAELQKSFEALKGKSDHSVPSLESLQKNFDLVVHNKGPYDRAAGPAPEPSESFGTAYKKGLEGGLSDSLGALRRMTTLKSSLEGELRKHSRPDVHTKEGYWGRTLGEFTGTLPAYLPGILVSSIPGAEVPGAAMLATTGAALSPEHPIAGAVGSVAPAGIGNVKIPGLSGLKEKFAKILAGGAIGGGTALSSGGDARDTAVSALLGGTIAGTSGKPGSRPLPSRDVVPTEESPAPPQPVSVSPPKRLQTEQTGHPLLPMPGESVIPLAEDKGVTPEPSPSQTPERPVADLVRKVRKRTKDVPEPDTKTLDRLKSELTRMGVTLSDEDPASGEPSFAPGLVTHLTRNGKEMARLKRDDYGSTGDAPLHEALQSVGESYRGAAGERLPESKGGRLDLGTLRNRLKANPDYRHLATGSDEALVTHAIKYANQTREARNKAYTAFEKVVPIHDIGTLPGWGSHPAKYVFNFKHKPYDPGDVSRVCE